MFRCSEKEKEMFEWAVLVLGADRGKKVTLSSFLRESMERAIKKANDIKTKN